MTRLEQLLPNPYMVDYQPANGPVDLYREQEMMRYANTIILDCADIVRSLFGDEAAVRIEHHFLRDAE